jgi:hypothetical protein
LREGGISFPGSDASFSDSAWNIWRMSLQPAATAVRWFNFSEF